MAGRPINGRPNEKGKKGTKAENTWRTAVYIRLSREDGSDESESVTNQKKIITEYLSERLDGSFKLVDFYIDDGRTGTDDDREGFARMIRHINEGRVNCVVCKTLSRAFRNYSDQGYYLEYFFPQKNVRFISTGDPQIDTYKNPEMLTGYEVPITGIMNDRFACRTSCDVRRTFDTKRRAGEFIGAFAPYGYLKSPENKNKLILDPDIVPIKREMLRLVLSGKSLGGVARRLNELGVPSPSAYKRAKGLKYSNPKTQSSDGLWNGSGVKRVLLDRVNLGHMVQGKQRVVSYKVHDRVNVPMEDWFVKENTHEPTFSHEEYDTLIRLLQRDTRELTGKDEIHIFAGLIRCGDCKKALHRKSVKDKTYYSCRTYAEKSKDKCARHSIRHDVLENAMLKVIQEQIARVDCGKIIDKVSAVAQIPGQNNHIKRLLEERRREKERLQSAADALYFDWKAGDLTRERYLRLEKKINARLLQLSQTIQTLECERQSTEQNASEKEAFLNFCNCQNVSRLDRGLLVELVDTIYIHKNNEITIIFNFSALVAE